MNYLKKLINNYSIFFYFIVKFYVYFHYSVIIHYHFLFHQFNQLPIQRFLKINPNKKIQTYIPIFDFALVIL